MIRRRPRADSGTPELAGFGAPLRHPFLGLLRRLP